MLGEKRSLLQPSFARVLSGGGGGGDARRGMTPQRNHEEHLHNTFPNAPTKRADSINQKKKKTKKKGERRRYQVSRLWSHNIAITPLYVLLEVPKYVLTVF